MLSSFCRHILLNLCFLLVAATAGVAQEKSIEISELVSRHLDAVGPASARNAAKSRFASGTVKFVGRVGITSNLEGSVGFVSLRPKTRYSIKFPALQYPGEQMAYDGKNVDVGFLPAGQRSPLSLFIQQQDLPLKDGLIGGVLSTGWPLMKDPVPARLDYKGTRKINGRLLHVVGYRQQKGSPDLKVTLFFDPETFQHIRTEYEFRIGARLGVGPNQSNVLQESIYLLTEDFEDFRKVDGLTLPYKCKMQLAVQASNSQLLMDWNISLGQIAHNQQIEDNVFTLK
ncbi:MAG TPA: hypothetical protein VFB82_05335 [Blastocatellia bacterium]|nr:hypothetical protein [Blastocatellia bacterium]